METVLYIHHVTYLGNKKTRKFNNKTKCNSVHQLGHCTVQKHIHKQISDIFPQVHNMNT